MRLKWTLFLSVSAWAALAILGTSAAADTPATDTLRTVRIDFYFEPGCEDCRRVRDEVLPALEDGFHGFFELHERDLGIRSNYLHLVARQNALGRLENAHVFMVLDETVMLAGFEEIAAGVTGALTERMAAPDGPAAESAKDDSSLISSRMANFTLAGIIIGGLIDGINPCAISTLVFLISVLAMTRISGHRLLVVGGTFCLASFITYTAIGFGLLRVLHTLHYFESLRRAIDAILIVLLLVLACLSFRDGFRFRRSRRASDVTLQLPAGIKNRIHRILRVGLGHHAQVASAFGIGALVTALESVCTGQVYVPTLALVVRSGTNVMRGLAYLLLYNLMFILPLIVVLIVTYRGLSLTRLMNWSANNVFFSKMLLGGFFVGMAVLMLLLK